MDRFDVTRRLLCEHLPADVVECVVHHARRDACARAVQACWRRVSSVGHARRPGWSDVRQPARRGVASFRTSSFAASGVARRESARRVARRDRHDRRGDARGSVGRSALRMVKNIFSVVLVKMWEELRLIGAGAAASAALAGSRGDGPVRRATRRRRCPRAWRRRSRRWSACRIRAARLRWSRRRSRRNRRDACRRRTSWGSGGASRPSRDAACSSASARR